MVVERRAVSDEQKKERRHEILAAARELFKRSDFFSVNMDRVARKSGLAKGTLFLYFKTKEELFLALAKEEITEWNDRFDALLAGYVEKKKKLTQKEILSLLESTFRGNDTLLHLVSILDATLEHNINHETARDFKFYIRNRAFTTGALLEQCLPELHPGEGMKIYMYANFLIIGIQHVANPSPVVKQVIEEKGMELFRIDFHTVFAEMMGCLLSGMLADRQQCAETVKEKTVAHHGRNGKPGTEKR
jgi:AcrR family transcriptional regulator